MELQRASAGSGKTFHLAKIFIREFLTYHRDIGGAACRPGEKVWEGTVRRYVLREPREIIQSHSHILAITFTNKATNEMKERVVVKLADLARGHRLEKDAEGNFRPAEYTDFLLRETVTAEGVPPTEAQVRATASAALTELLDNYTDFNISTIDSFFQQILRTLAFELDLNDNLELELDSGLLNSAGVDMTLRSANHPSDPDHVKAKEWLRQLMEIYQRRAEKWDILSGGARKSRLHSELLKIADKASRENFRDRLRDIRVYFSSANWNGTGLSGAQCFRRYYDQTTEHYALARYKAWKECIDAVNHFETVCVNCGVGAADLARGVEGAILPFRTVNNETSPKVPTSQIFRNLTADDATPDIIFKAKSKAGPEARATVGAAAIDAARKGAAFASASDIFNDITGRLFFVGLLGLISDNTERFRESNNLLPLSDTNTILSGIVNSQDDAPFIFERMGSMLHHFLIDEFQDTSRSQWEVMRPLVGNAEGSGFDNLIIGDAKQSIYRFRDAEPELISYGVEHDFPATNARATATPNVNWRSSATVVEFNNRLFEHLSRYIDSTMPPFEGIMRRSPLPIYRNVRQKAHHADAEGYVQVSFGKTDAYIGSLGELITRLVEEGWRQRDIAVLCDRNSDCHQVIDALLAHNREEGAMPIEIVSEEALSVSESNAVKMIIAVLSIVARGNLHTPEETRRKGDKRNREMTRQDLELMTAMRMETDSGNDIGAISAPADDTETVPPGAVDEMLADMPAIALPALVEAIASRFLSPRQRTADCAYIAAFQDCVLDFCEKYPADPASFLQWWEESGHKVNVAAPEGGDAVTVMTVHKSKGLEYGVVIVPKATWALDISKREEEIIWAEPAKGTCSDDAMMPPAVPIGVGRGHELTRTPYAARYLEEYDRSRIDKLNEAYVAFTRAAGELHINAELGSGMRSDIDKGRPCDSASLSGYLYRMLLDINASDPAFCRFDGEIFHCGTQGAAARNPLFRKKESVGLKKSTVHEYYVNAPMPRLRTLPSDDIQGAVENTRPTPRDYGNQLHDVMAGVEYTRDLDASILRMKVRGCIDESTAVRIRRRILEALSLPEAAEWFADDARVLTERTVLRGGDKARRPDRVVDTGSKIIIIDYKTGAPAVTEEYSLQLRRYTGLYRDFCRLRGMERSVEGHLLFLPSDNSLPCSSIRIA